MINGKTYCLEYGYSETCNKCQHSKNWKSLNEMPFVWMKKQQKEMTRIDETECGLNGRVLFKASAQ